MTEEEKLIKEINGVLGALDGKTLKRARRLLSYLNLHHWGYNELLSLIDLQSLGDVSMDNTLEQRDYINEKLHNGLHEADLKLEEH